MTPLIVLAAAMSMDLDAYRWSKRVLLQFGDPVRQSRLFEPVRSELLERDLVVLPVEGKDELQLRKRFRLSQGFALILIGKDGGEKGRWTTPVLPREIFQLIDTMPMRRSEMSSKAK